jgi:hypothetical protein
VEINMADLEKIARELKGTKYWAEREKRIEKEYTDTPHLDTYIVTVRIPITFARENDGVANVEEAREWLEHGDILESSDEGYEIIKVEQKEA